MKKSYSDPSIYKGQSFLSPKKAQKTQKRVPSANALNDLSTSIEALNYAPVQTVAMCVLSEGGENDIKSFAACVASPPDLQHSEIEPIMQQQESFRTLYSLVRRVRRKSSQGMRSLMSQDNV